MPTPADRGTPAPAPVAPSADIRIGYARCSSLAQELQSQLDALAGHGIPRDKIFSENRALAEHEKTQAYPEAVEAAHADFAALQQRDRGPV
ncbi:hypothetical protein AB0I52_21115 [Streptomyces sp. NPDC050423]|uniref:hypothetical protein n=1 Tax=Streptomyces sp. NPDC050423 TaxID=3155402 RepID=UPI0034385DFF